MKLNNIKTSKEFWFIVNMWNERLHKLRIIWQNENESLKRKMKAFILWRAMCKRVLKLVQEINKSRRVKIPIKFETGGYSGKLL